MIGTWRQVHVYQQAWLQQFMRTQRIGIVFSHITHTYTHLHTPTHTNALHQIVKLVFFEANAPWKPPHACAVSVSGTFRSALASASSLRVTIVNILTSEYHVYTSILTATRVTSLPAAFNFSSPQDCGSCRQLLLSASPMVYCYTHGRMLFTAEPEADGGSAEESKKKADQTERFQEGAFQVMPVDEKLKRHKKGALRGKKKMRRKITRLPTEPARSLFLSLSLSLSFQWCWGPDVRTATRQRGGARVGSVTTEGKNENDRGK